MNEDKKILDLSNKITKKEIPINQKNYGSIKIKTIIINKVKFILQDFVDVDELRTGLDIIKLEKEQPDALVEIKPPLYNSFIDTRKNTIRPYVKVGQKVEEENVLYTVLDVRFKRLNDMTVIVADLENIQTGEKSFALTNKLNIKNES
jgi:hypothetical protein